MTVLDFPTRNQRYLTPSQLRDLGIPGLPGEDGIVLDELVGQAGDLELRRTVFTCDQRFWQLAYAVHTDGTGTVWWGGGNRVRASAVEARQTTSIAYEVST